MDRYVNYALPTAYLRESRIDTAMDGKNIIRKRSAQAEENIASYVHLSEIRLCFPTKDWKKYVTDKEIIDKMSKTREEVKKKLDRVIKLMPKKKVVTYEIDFKNCAGYTPSPLEI